MNKDSMIKGNKETREVTIDGTVLDPSKSQEVSNHSPDGFNWGYTGSGPAQLALALLMEITDVEEASRLYHGLKFDIISFLEGDFSIKGEQILEWLGIERGKPQNMKKDYGNDNDNDS